MPEIPLATLKAALTLAVIVVLAAWLVVAQRRHRPTGAAGPAPGQGPGHPSGPRAAPDAGSGEGADGGASGG
jgi:hypothetical protein